MCLFFTSSGIKAVDKREGGGSHNWGTFEDEIKAEEDKNVSIDEATGEPKEGGAGEEGRPQRRERPQRVLTKEEEEALAAEQAAREEEAKQMTLDEWKAAQGKKDGPKFNLRKAGEGSDIDPKWKKTYAYKKEREVNEDSDEEVRTS